MKTSTKIENTSFRYFIFKEKKTDILIIIILCVAEFILLKSLYPFPSFFADSYAYIFGADLNLRVNIWPIGYSWFLAIFHLITSSDKALICFQFFAYLFSAGYFYHSVLYFYPISRFGRICLSIFLFFNPLFLYLSNYVSSDILFISMSMIWITQLIWILQRPRLYRVFIEAGLLFFLFAFRYNALIYPFIASFVFLVIHRKVTFKIFGMLIGPILIIPFIIWSAHAAKNMTGVAQFPPILGGWQWANNALYMREYIEVDSTAFPTTEIVELDRMARTYFRTFPPQHRNLSECPVNFFIVHQEAPLHVYVAKKYPIKTYSQIVFAWGKTAVIFDQYGKYLIKRYPLAFFQHYLLLNAKKYFLPPLEELSMYNDNNSAVWPIAKTWFQFPSRKIEFISTTAQSSILGIFPYLFLTVNVLYSIALLVFVGVKAYKLATPVLNQTIFIISLFLGLNFAFSVFANIIVLRYQIFPMIIFLVFTLVIAGRLQLYFRQASGESIKGLH